MINLPSELIIEILKFDISNINILRLFSKEYYLIINNYLKQLLNNKNYILNLNYFENKFFLNIFLNNFFIKENPTIRQKIFLYTFIYDLNNMNNKYIFFSNVIAFFEKKCYSYAKESFFKNDFSLYEKKTKKMKIIFHNLNNTLYLYNQKMSLDVISQKIYNSYIH